MEYFPTIKKGEIFPTIKKIPTQPIGADSQNLLSGKPSSYPLGGFSAPLEGCFLTKKSAIVYLFVYFLRFYRKIAKIKICRKVQKISVNKEKVPQNNRLRYSFLWSECRDSNPRPLGPEPSAIPNFATPRKHEYYMHLSRICQVQKVYFGRNFIE